MSRFNDLFSLKSSLPHLTPPPTPSGKRTMADMSRLFLLARGNDILKNNDPFQSVKITLMKEQGRTHGYLSRMGVGRGGEKKLSVTAGRTDR